MATVLLVTVDERIMSYAVMNPSRVMSGICQAIMEHTAVTDCGALMPIVNEK